MTPDECEATGHPHPWSWSEGGTLTCQGCDALVRPEELLERNLLPTARADALTLLADRVRRVAQNRQCADTGHRFQWTSCVGGWQCDRCGQTVDLERTARIRGATIVGNQMVMMPRYDGRPERG